MYTKKINSIRNFTKLFHNIECKLFKRRFVYIPKFLVIISIFISIITKISVISKESFEMYKKPYAEIVHI